MLVSKTLMRNIIFLSLSKKYIFTNLWQVCKGDQIVVDVRNEMVNGEGISIHWHGQYQNFSPYMDGVGMVTQCPILPYTSFRYNFTASNPGTHWWHGHTGVHRSDGLFGALIVRQPDEVWRLSLIYAVKVRRHKPWSRGPLSWIPGMWFTLCQFRLSISLAMAHFSHNSKIYNIVVHAQ